MNRTDYVLVETCGACPEQYDVKLDDKVVGYLRLRHGNFYAQHIDQDSWGEIVYEASPQGDGIFEEYERNFYLNAAVAALDEHIHAPDGRNARNTEMCAEPIGWTR